MSEQIKVAMLNFLDWLQHPSYTFVQAVLVGFVPGGIAVYLLWRGLSDFRQWEQRKRVNERRGLVNDWEQDLDNRVRRLM